MEQLESYLPLVQVNCLLHHILCVQDSDQLPDLTSGVRLASSLQHHHAGALQHQLHDHIIHRELVPQSGNMKNHMIKYKGNPIRFTVIRLFTNHGYNNHLLVGYHQHAHPHHGLPLDKPELRQVHHLHHQLAEHERGAEIKLAHDHHLLRQGVLRPVDLSVVLIFNIHKITGKFSSETVLGQIYFLEDEVPFPTVYMCILSGKDHHHDPAQHLQPVHQHIINPLPSQLE